MGPQPWNHQISLGFGFAPFWWRWPRVERFGMQLALYFGPFCLSASWIEPDSAGGDAE